MKIKNLALFAVVIFSALVLTGCKSEPVAITNNWIRLPLQGMNNTAGFITITNNSSNKLVLTGASSSVFDKIELHTMTMNGDLMKMNQVESFEINPGEKTELKPHGNHLMMMGIKKQLMEGDHVDLTLEFGDASKMKLEMVVKKDY